MMLVTVGASPAPDDNSGQPEIVNVDPGCVRDTDTNIGCNVTCQTPETHGSWGSIMIRVTHLLTLSVFVCQSVSSSPIPGPQVSLVRFPSLKNLLTSVTDLFDNIHRRSFNLPSKVKLKPSYKPHNVVPVSIPGALSLHHSLYSISIKSISVKNIPKEEFHPILPLPQLTYHPPPNHPAPLPASLPIPSYKQFWSYFPLGRVTPLNIEDGIRKASQDVDHDGICTSSHVTLCVILWCFRCGSPQQLQLLQARS